MREAALNALAEEVPHGIAVTPVGHSHPKVVDVAVFGVPNDDFGEEVKAVVQPVAMPASSDEADVLAKELMAFCRSQLADVKCPRSVDFREELPRHPTGKLYKRLLKDEYWRAAGRSI